MSEHEHPGQPQLPLGPGRKTTKGNGSSRSGQSLDPTKRPGWMAPTPEVVVPNPAEPPTDELAEVEAAITGSRGNSKTQIAQPADGDETSALVEIEEAIDNGANKDPIDLEEANLSYPIRKPFRSRKNFEFFMSHPDLNLWITAWVVAQNLDMDEQYYLPTANVLGDLLDHLVHVEFVPCINSRGRIFLWPIPCDDVTGKSNKWTSSARTAVKLARTRLTKILSDRDEQKYRTFHPKNVTVPLPVWPEDFNRQTMLARMFRDHVIRDLDNDVARDCLNAGHKITK